MKAPFIKIEPEFLKKIAGGNYRTPRLYYHRNILLRNFFWLRLKLINNMMSNIELYTNTASCLDFGGGSGVFLPTLASRFSQADCIDLDPSDAYKVMEKFNLKNVNIIQGDINNQLNIIPQYDVVVAADVLEHFHDLNEPLNYIDKTLKTNGYLFTSLPTETGVYKFIRNCFNIKPPPDHYHTSNEVEEFIFRSGFIAVMRKYLPFIFCPLFVITAWKRKMNNE